MGGVISDQKAVVQVLVKKATPRYYIQNVVLTDDDIHITMRIWSRITKTSDDSEDREGFNNFDCYQQSLSLQFFNAFYNHILILSTEGKFPLRTRISRETTDVIIDRFLSSSFKCIRNLSQNLEIVGARINENYSLGIKSTHYGPMGEALLWALKVVLGNEYDDNMNTAWTRLYSYLLNITLVKAAECEVVIMNQDQHYNREVLYTTALIIRSIFSSESIRMIYKMTSGDRIAEQYAASIKAQMVKYQPNYFIANIKLNKRDVEIALKSWTQILSGENTEPFAERKRIDPNFEYSSSLTWFYDAFYGKFFELYPAAKPLFAHVSMVAQGKLIAGLISSSLESVREPIKVNERLRHVAYKHSQRGIRAEQYGVMGHALLWVLELVIGKSFDAAAKTAWTRIYCHILNIILPVAAEYEVNKQREAARISMKLSGKFASIKRSLSKGSIKSNYTVTNNEESCNCPAATTAAITGGGESSSCPRDKPMFLSIKRALSNSSLSNRSLPKSLSWSRSRLTNSRKVMCMCDEDEDQITLEQDGTAIGEIILEDRE